jgi:hypothetical protein
VRNAAPASNPSGPPQLAGTANEPIRVENRSDRLRVCREFRSLPLWILVAVNLVPHALPKSVRLPTLFWAELLVIDMLVVAVIDLAPFLHPVTDILLGERLRVHRLNRVMSEKELNREFGPDEVLSVEFARPRNQDYDEWQLGKAYSEVTFRFSKSWPAWLFVTREEADRIRTWAAAHGRPVIECSD